MPRSDPAAASAELLALNAAQPGQVSDGDFNRIAGKMGEAKHFTEATKLLGEGLKLYPDSKHLDTLGNSLLKAAQSAGDSDAVDALAGLGYTG